MAQSSCASTWPQRAPGANEPPGNAADGMPCGPIHRPRVLCYRARMLKHPVDVQSLRRVPVTKLRHHGDVLLASPVFSVLRAAQALQSR